jgi:hypothetical protein
VAETAKMVAELDLKTGKFTKGVSTAVGSLGKLTGSVAKSRAVAVGLGVGLERAGEAGLRAFAGAIGDGLQSMADLETAATANAAAIQQVGLAGQVTADQISAWSVQIETAVGSAFDDKQINAAAGTLIRYGKVTAQNLEPALVVMTDLAAKTGDVESAATLLAKALADPEKAAGKLARQGIILTKQQQDQIKAFVKAGKTAQAQQVILEALSKTTAGAAKASQGPYQQSINQLRDAYEEATKALAVGFLPLITKVRDILTTELAKPETLANIKAFGTSLASGLSSLIDVARSLPWNAIGNALKIAGTGAKAVLDAFLAMPAWVQTAIVTGWGLNKLTGGALSGALTGLVGNIAKSFLQSIGLMKINAAVVQVSGPVSGAPASAAGAAGKAATGLSLLSKVALIGETVGLVVAVNQVRDGIANASTAQATGLQSQTAQFIASQPNKAQLETALAGVNQGIHDLEFNPLNVLVQGEALDKLRGMRADLEKAIENSGRPAINPQGGAGTQPFGPFTDTQIAKAAADLAKAAAGIQTAAAQRDAETSTSIQDLIAQTDLVARSTDIETLRGVTDRGLATVDTSTVRGASQTSAAATNAGYTSAQQTFATGLGIEGAIRANRPIIDVTVNISATTVRDTVTVADRGGSRSGSRDGDGGGGPGQ